MQMLLGCAYLARNPQIPETKLVAAILGRGVLWTVVWTPALHRQWQGWERDFCRCACNVGVV